MSQDSMTRQEAWERLQMQYGDKVAIEKAFKMLGSREMVTQQVSGNFSRLAYDVFLFE